MSQAAEVINLDEFRKRREARVTPQRALAVSPVNLWTPVWVWVMVWPT